MYTLNKGGHKAGLVAVMVALLALGLANPVMAANPPTTQSGSVGIQGIIPSTPPTHGATITVPGNGAVFTNVPITVSGLCPTGLLVKIFDNNVFVGSAVCTGGSFSLQIDLFSGRNDLVAKVYDSLDQPGPDSSTVTVTFNDAQFSQFGTLVSLTSIYAERGAAPGSELDWPVLLSGGNGPYAISVDWGDGTAQDLLSRSTPGTFNLSHVYKQSGVYNVIIKATDKNGQKAFLQLVGQATGAIQHNDTASASGKVVVEKTVLWWPALLLLPAALVSFWLGRRSQLQAIRKRNS